MNPKATWKLQIGALAFISSLTCVLAFQDRTDFFPLIALYAASFASYWFLINSKTRSFKLLLSTAILGHLIALLFLPYLSIDYFRFLWDGELVWLGINPFEFRPVDLAHQPFVESSTYLQELYEGIGYTSQRNHTVYPTINQLYFILSTAFSGNIMTNVMLLKSLVLITELAGGIYLFKLLRLFQIDKHKLWILFLNPLWIIETMGNVHFEGVMISFLIIAFYFLAKQNYLWMTVFFTIAIQIKLIPLMLLPFLIRYTGTKKAVGIYIGIGVLFIATLLVFVNGGNWFNFYTSLRLYFKVFEFNSFALYYTIQIGQLLTGWNQIQVLGPLFSLITLYVIGKLSFKKGEIDWLTMVNRMTLVYLLYLLLSNTMHPWYMLPLLFLSVFTSYSFAIVWSGLIFLSYSFYQTEMSTDISYRIITFLEYILLLYVIYLELKKKQLLLPWLRVNAE